MPTDLTALREAWATERGIQENLAGAPVYEPPVTFAMVDDLARRAYDQAVADCIKNVYDYATDYPLRPQYVLPRIDTHGLIERLKHLAKGASQGEKGGE